MIGSLGKRSRGHGASEILMAFVQSWSLSGQDDISICSRAVDVLRAYLGDRPCCVWKNVRGGLTKVCERGMIEILFNQDQVTHQNSLARTLISGASEYDPCDVDLFTSDVKGGIEGLINVPIKIQEEVLGILSLAIFKKEWRDRAFVQTLECLGRLVAIAIQHGSDVESNVSRERKLRAELEATMRELAQTNSRLIERVRELKTLSKELEKRVEELTYANKAKDEFLSIVSHELRTPLTSLKGFLCVLLDEEAGSITEPQRKFLSIAKQSADRLNVLISDLLDVSRIESGRLNLNMSVCSLFDILQKSVEGLKKVAEVKNIKIEYESSPNLPEIWADSNRIQQVVDNILSNALKFTSHQGVVRVISEDKGDGIQVSIKDNGPGISAQEKSKIFDMFYQVDTSTRRANGGAGLGLAIAHGIVSMHGGKLWVDSELGKGCEFKFIIPRYKAQKVA